METQRLEIELEPELNRGLERVAETHGITKEELVCRYLRGQLELLRPIETDPVVQLFGTFTGGYPWDSERHDEAIEGDDG